MFVYMLLCRDGSIYTGVAADLMRRMRDHFERTASVAAYTRAKGASYLLGAWECQSRSVALRAEYAIKRLSRKEKEALLAEPTRLGGACFPTLEGEALLPLREDDERLLAVRAAYPPQTDP